MPAIRKEKMLNAMNKLKEKRESEYLTLESKITQLTKEKETLKNEYDKLKSETNNPVAIKEFEDKINLLVKEKEKLKSEYDKLKSEADTTIVLKEPVINNNNVPQQLDQVEEQIKILKNDITSYGWLIGQRLSFIHEKKLYKDTSTSFYDYCLQELEITKQTAYNLMFLFREFSYDNTKKFGSKLYLLQKIKAKEERIKMIDWIEKNSPSYRQLEEKVKSHHINSTTLLESPIAELPVSIHKGRKKITIDYATIIPTNRHDEFYNRLEALIEEFVSNQK